VRIVPRGSSIATAATSARCGVHAADVRQRRAYVGDGTMLILIP